MSGIFGDLFKEQCWRHFNLAKWSFRVCELKQHDLNLGNNKNLPNRQIKITSKYGMLITQAAYFE